MDIKQTILDVISYEKDNKKLSRSGIAERFGVSEHDARGIRFFIDNKDALLNDGVKDYGVKFEETTEGNIKTITTTSIHLRTEEDVIKYHEIDIDKWRPKSFKVNSWNVTIGKKNTGTGKPETYTNFQTTLNLERVTLDKLSIKQQAEQFKAFVKSYKPKLNWIKSYKRIKSDYALEISLPDFHFGQLSWHAEVGDNYDVKIASALWIDAIKYYAALAVQFKAEKLILPIGHDWFNVNSAANTTFRGTPQDEDCRWQKTFHTGWMLVAQGIDILLQVADVDLIIVPGNHDTERTYYMGEVLGAYYKDHEAIRIDNRPIIRKYRKYGENLIGMGHGDGEKPQELPMIMLMEAKELFAQTSYWEFHHGHFHHFRRLVQDLIDYKCVIVKGMPSLVPLSVYSKKHAYMSARQAIGTLWDKKGGIKGEFPYYP